MKVSTFLVYKVKKCLLKSGKVSRMLNYHNPKRDFFSALTIKEGSTSLPKPFSPQGTRDVAGSAIAPPEFWYRKRSLCPKGLAMISYATE